MKFKNKHTGVILEPKSDMVVEQLQKNPDFEPYDGQNAAQDAGIAVPDGATKAQIVELIEAAKGE